MGAMAGAFYAAGYTPAEMQSFLLRESRAWFAPGTLFQEERYYKLQKPHDLTLVEVPIDFLTKGDLPLPEQLFSDFEINIRLNERLTPISLGVRDRFDSLLVPYRAVGADLYRKKLYSSHREAWPPPYASLYPCPSSLRLSPPAPLSISLMAVSMTTSPWSRCRGSLGRILLLEYMWDLHP